MTPDTINGLFEFCGAFAIYRNCYLVNRDRRVAGVSWTTTGFFAAWGLWNLFYYPSLHQWFSFAGGLALVACNLLWVVLLWHYSERQIIKRTEREIERMFGRDSLEHFNGDE